MSAPVTPASPGSESAPSPSSQGHAQERSNPFAEFPRARSSIGAQDWDATQELPQPARDGERNEPEGDRDRNPTGGASAARGSVVQTEEEHLGTFIADVRFWAEHADRGLLDRLAAGSSTLVGWPLVVLQRLERCFRDAAREDDGIVPYDSVTGVLRQCFPEADPAQVAKLTKQLRSDMGDDSTAAPGLVWRETLCYVIGVTASHDDEQLLSDIACVRQCDKPEGWQETLWVIMEQNVHDRYRDLCPEWILRTGWWVAVASQLVILLSSAVMVGESFERYQPRGESDATAALEATCIAIFTVEFALRTLACPFKEEHVRGAMVTQKVYWFNPWTWIDALAIFPFFMSLSGTRSLLALRVLRLLKLGRHNRQMQLMGTALFRARMALFWMTVLAAVDTLLFSALIFHIEKDQAHFYPEQGLWIRDEDSDWIDKGEPIDFQSIPEAMWWVLVTICTVGYGDLYPVTPLGKTASCGTLMSGILILSYPVTMLTSAFADVHSDDEYNRIRLRQREAMRRILMPQGPDAASVTPTSPVEIPASSGLSAGFSSDYTDHSEQQKRSGSAGSPPPEAGALRLPGTTSDPGSPGVPSLGLPPGAERGRAGANDQQQEAMRSTTRLTQRKSQMCSQPGRWGRGKGRTRGSAVAVQVVPIVKEGTPGRMLSTSLEELQDRLSALYHSQSALESRFNDAAGALVAAQEAFEEEFLAQLAHTREELLATYTETEQRQRDRQAVVKEELRQRVRELVAATEPLAAGPELEARLAQLSGRADEIELLRDFESHIRKRIRDKRRGKKPKRQRPAREEPPPEAAQVEADPEPRRSVADSDDSCPWDQREDDTQT